VDRDEGEELMSWRDTAVVPEGAEPIEGAADAIADILPDGERILLACRTSRFAVDMWQASIVTVILTNRTLMVVKDRLFGRPKPSKVIPLQEITSCGCGPLLGVGPTWQVTFTGKHRAAGSIYFPGPVQAEQVEKELRSAVSNLLAETRDPDLAQLNRELAAAKAQPEGDLGENLTPTQVIEESRRMRQQLASGDLRAAWDRRVQLGYGVPTDEVPQADRFWLNAAPAVAALRLGLKDHPMVAMCCGVAEGDHDRNDAEQRATVQEFKRLFFG
jgi:hypothetical protein